MAGGVRDRDSPGSRRQLGTSCSPFPLKTKQGKMGLNCSKGDLGQIEGKPAGAAGTGTLGADGISFPGDLWERGLQCRPAPSPGPTGQRPWAPLARPGARITCEHTRDGITSWGLSDLQPTDKPRSLPQDKRFLSCLWLPGLKTPLLPSLSDSFVLCQSLHDEAARKILS